MLFAQVAVMMANTSDGGSSANSEPTVNRSGWNSRIQSYLQNRTLLTVDRRAPMSGPAIALLFVRAFSHPGCDVYPAAIAGKLSCYAACVR